MEKVVYILGAGFSAPLGLPVMSNFLEKSKDQYFKEPDKYKYFQEVFASIDKMQKAKSYYETDLFNIEDILSILEFRTKFDTEGNEEEKREQFLRYIQDVINYYTPDETLKNTPNQIFVSGEWNPYIRFVAAITRSQFGSRQDALTAGHNELHNIFIQEKSPQIEYSVITLNYDLILESIERHFLKLLSTPRFNRTLDKSEQETYLAKLHGSVDTNDIVPPTWNKGLNFNTAVLDWKVAYKTLSEANYIRILGYSLPITDTYIRYLLRAAIVDTPHLKRIDVLCLDQSGQVKKSYDEFIKFKNYRFLSQPIETYLEADQYSSNQEGLIYFGLETGHNKIFK